MKPRQWLHRIILFTRNRFRFRIERLGHRTTHQDRILIGQMDYAIDVAGAENIGHGTKNRMVFLAGLDHSASALSLVSAVMTDPLLAENLAAELTERDIPELLVLLAHSIQRLEEYAGVAMPGQKSDPVGGANFAAQVEDSEDAASDSVTSTETDADSEVTDEESDPFETVDEPSEDLS